MTRYDKEFQLNTVDRSVNTGKSTRQTAQNFGVPNGKGRATNILEQVTKPICGQKI